MKQPRNIDNDFLFLIYDVAQLMRRHADKHAREHGMTRAQWAVLARLERQPDITQNELAGLTDVEPITVGRLIDKLQESGFVERIPDPRDRRIWRLRLTKKCDPVLRDIATFRRQLHNDMSAGLDAQTLSALTNGLLGMRSNLSIAKASNRKDDSQ